ncbi:GNAT family N-acetyltransferase [Phenylobacterium sp.]|uniref:GNAT family N-acetyltransferase n=1 Tax=Phenylobacterium sp. TaxID=1871053 RepID=UPI002730E4C9|nr:GNAT family N-acetyltransferase [Phenylobacterium sp.]MDP1618006.1 GNAT family N-acetyltransferase [Phenylobacterium sp.]MDP1985725.1 GNAT family N-acetyltransferase [Phenylobacterium sp.]
MPVTLETPSLDLLPAYADALRRGWSADNVRGKAAADEELERIAADPEAFVRSLDNPDGGGPPVMRLDGSLGTRLPSIRRWIWDEGFCGAIGLRWGPGGGPLPDWFPYGHIGYAVPPWRRGRGYASQALTLLLPEAPARGLDYVELTTDTDNPASQQVVIKNGGVLVARERDDAVHGGVEILRWRIDL